jgi:acyl-coenzyme A thioesterase PaaI-like protein
VARRPVGSCLAAFALPHKGAGAATPLPWEAQVVAPDPPPAPVAPPGPEEARVLALRQAAPAASLADALVTPQLDEAGPGRASGRIEAGEILLNRAGHVQGGALAGLAVASARAAARAPAGRVISAHVTFLRPAAPGCLGVQARVLRAGGRAVFAEAELRQASETVSRAMLVLGPDDRRSAARP